MSLPDPKTSSVFKGHRLPVAVLGATGSVGQRFVALLDHHPWFELSVVTASERSAGRTYGQAVSWMQARPLPAASAALEVRPTTPEAVAGCSIVFSALDAAVAGRAEESIARAGCVVVSNAKSHRLRADVPLVVPEVNADHLGLLKAQTFGGGGALITNPNCATIGLTLALKPLVDAFGLEVLHVVTLQALSGAGRPTPASLGVLDNVVPFIEGEEEKLQLESRKILGRLHAGVIEPHALTLSAACNRVPVLDGHLQCVSVRLERKATEADLLAAWRDFRALPQELDLPSAPGQPVHLLVGDAVPQPRLHRELEHGMAISVGRLRPCPVFDWKFVTLSHNTLRGAAGGALLLAELALARGDLAGRTRP